MLKYDVIVEDSIIVLIKKVNDKLRDGWELYGSFATKPYIYCQAMIYKEPTKEIING